MKSLLLSTLLALPGRGQRFDGEPLTPIVYPGISDGCASALNTAMPKCPAFLGGEVSTENLRLDSDQLSMLCTADCYSSLMRARQVIASACSKRESDVIVHDNIVWPATLIIDRFIYTYNLSCRKDVASGRFCDEILTSWLGQPGLTAAQNCSDCLLGSAQMQLNSPFGYDDSFAADFRATTVSCGASGYAFTSPTAYIINATATPPAPPPRSPPCLEPYRVQPGDNCDAIATSQRVATYAVINAGGLNPTCSSLRVGSLLCLPSPCQLYRVQHDDTCDKVVGAHAGITPTNLLAWNANLDPLCSSLDPLAESLICVSPPGGRPGNASTMTEPPSIPATGTPVPKPTNAPPESNARCAVWYTIQEGDYCQAVSIRRSISLDDFYFLNPQINRQCSNLLLGLAYCVQAVGNIASYSGYPSSSPLFTLTSINFTTTTASTLDQAPASITPVPVLPTAPGTVADCQEYIEYFLVPPPMDQTGGSVVSNSINSCDYATSVYEVSLPDFLSWNPSLASVSPCYLQTGYRYCALGGSLTQAAPSPTSSISVG